MIKLYKDLLQHRKIKVRTPGSPRATYQLVSAFWAHTKNSHLPLDRVLASHASQCHFTRLCSHHTALITPKSLLFNFQNLRRTSLDCKPCRVFNNAKHAVLPSRYEEVAYRAVAALPSALGICPSDMLVDHRIDGLENSPSPVDIYLPAINLCIMVDGEGHFSDSRRAAQEPHVCTRVPESNRQQIQ